MKIYLQKLIFKIKEANYRRLRKRREPQRIAYRDWVREHDTVTPEKKRKLQEAYASLKSRPLISVIMPVYNPSIKWLDEAIESVRAQIYQEWELCIADDCSTDANVRMYLERKAQAEARLKLMFRPINGHISAASNSAINIASGEFLALMDQDDLIPPDAFLHVVDCINKNPDACLIYSDEDKVDEVNARQSPILKKKWGIDKISEFNCVSHLGVYKADLVRDVGGFREGYEGSQDHDLVLRCMKKIKAQQIIHIEKILYHWRIHSNSTAYMESAKPYAAKARVRAIADYINDNDGDA